MLQSSPTPLELAEYEKELSALRSKMSGPEFEGAWEDDQKLTMDKTMTLATQEG